MVEKEDSSMEVQQSPIETKEAPIAELGDVQRLLSYITRGVELNQPRLLQRAIRQNAKVRRYISPSVLHQIICSTFPNKNLTPALKTGLQKLCGEDVTFDEKMDVDGDAKPFYPEVEVYLSTLLVTTLLRHKENEMAAYCASALIERIRSFNRRSLDVLSAKAYFYFSLAYERIHRLENIRSILLGLYRTACLHHDELSQAVLVTLILRNYLHYNLYGQAQILTAKTSFPENASNNQYCRYLYYEGRIQAVQLQYSDAYLRLTMAARKAPQDSSSSFIVEVNKLTIIVQLLMGDIPERALFNQSELRHALKPYFYLTLAVRNGDMPQFNATVEKFSDTFERDRNLTLIQRLGFNVMKIGLRKIYLSYSRISLADIADKLHLPSLASAEYICAKAIR